jgi:hypothetical protein
MGKNTHHITLSNMDVIFDNRAPQVTDEAEPSRLTIENILNYSKALKVEQCNDGKNFIEYISN